jgi:hypothetical protein
MTTTTPDLFGEPRQPARRIAQPRRGDGTFAPPEYLHEMRRVEQHLLWLIDMHRERFTAKFRAWLPGNFHVWRAFEKEALRVAGLGFKHYSARTILHYLRHHTNLAEQSGDGWKINDHHSPYLARLFELVHPMHRGLWEMRETKATSVREAETA